MSAGEISEKITKNERLGELIYERNIEFDKNWLFHKEDENDALSPKGYGYAYLSAKTERMKSGPAAYRHYDRPGFVVVFG